MSEACRDCREGVAHCHGTAIRHWLRRSECTEAGCDDPDSGSHGFVVDCDAVGCGCGFDPPGLQPIGSISGADASRGGAGCAAG
jgi:hypothetical protein